MHGTNVESLPKAKEAFFPDHALLLIRPGPHTPQGGSSLPPAFLVCANTNFLLYLDVLPLSLSVAPWVNSLFWVGRGGGLPKLCRAHGDFKDEDFLLFPNPSFLGERLTAARGPSRTYCTEKKGIPQPKQ